MSRLRLKFVDLFSGLGGFHVALSRLGHKCVFASEIDSELQELYFYNFGIRPHSDIRFSWKDVPCHDVLCAGFPCQPFSKAGSQSGFDCPIYGDLFEYILRIIDLRRPRYILLENVPNIIRHSDGETWRRIHLDLETRGYAVESNQLSPHQFGVPQVRSRALIVGARDGLEHFSWPKPDCAINDLHISTVLDAEGANNVMLPDSYIHYLEVWEEFLERLGPNVALPSFPIWSMEFGADYPCEKKGPVEYNYRYLARFHGAFGEKLSGKTKGQQLAFLPPYARSERGAFPAWKIRFVKQNRAFYLENKDRLIGWLPRVKIFPPSFQKFEWNWREGGHTIWDKIIQFRASGIRVKNPATAPSLVALTTSQVPVIAWEKRYMTILECARLQSLDGLDFLPSAKTKAFKALGNAVNADVVQRVLSNLLAVESQTNYAPVHDVECASATA